MVRGQGSLSIPMTMAVAVIGHQKGRGTNDKIKSTISTLEKWRFIDICNPMLKAGYDKFYDQDQLHMNDLGYSLLSKSLRDEIAKIN